MLAGLLLLLVGAFAVVLTFGDRSGSGNRRADQVAYRAPSGASSSGGTGSATVTGARAGRTTSTTTAPPKPPVGATNPLPPTPRPADGRRPTVVYFGDSMSVNAAPEIKEQLDAAGYDLVHFEAFIGNSMCKDEASIDQTVVQDKPDILVLQYVGNGSLWNCVDGYQPTYDLYHRALTSIGANAAFNGAPGGTHVVLVGALPHADGTPLYPGSPGVTDAFRDVARTDPRAFSFVDPTPGLVPGPGALVACYPQEPGCGPDGRIQVRPDDHNPFTGATVMGGGSHFCLDSTLVSLAEEDCNVHNAGGLRFAYDVVDGIRAAGL